MNVCKSCEPRVKDVAAKWRFYLPVLLFMIVNIAVWGYAISLRLDQLQEAQFQKRLVTNLQYQLNEGTLQASTAAKDTSDGD